MRSTIMGQLSQFRSIPLGAFALSALGALASAPAQAASVITLDQVTAIADGVQICDATASFCLDFTLDAASTETATFNAATGRVTTGNLVQNGELLIFNIDATGSPTPFILNAINLPDIDSMTDGATAADVRDAYAWSAPGSWVTDKGAIVSIDTGAADGVGSFVIPDPDGVNDLSLIGDFNTFPAGASDVFVNMNGDDDDHNVTYTLATPAPSVQLYLTNSGGLNMDFALSLNIVLNQADPTLTLAKSVDNTGGGTAVAGDFTLSFTDGGANAASGVSGDAAVTDVSLPEGDYTLSETTSASYTGALACVGTLDSDPSDGLTLTDGEEAVCTFTNTFAPSGVITLVKTADTSGLSSPPAPGDVITYAFTAENTGNVALTNVTLTDPTATVSGGPIASLGVGATDSTTFTASYTVTQADVDAGSVSNQATVTASQPVGSDVSDLSGTAADNDDPTVVSLAAVTGVTLVKTADTSGLSSPTVAGDVITYSFEIANTGNTTLTNVTITDPSATVTGGPIASLAAGATDTTTVTASYTLTQADVDAGSFQNQATVTATAPDSSTVTDLSGTAVDNDDPTIVALAPAGGLEVTKTFSGTLDAVGDVATFEITVENTGNVTLTNVALTDTLTRLDGTVLAVDAPPALLSSSRGSLTGTLLANEVATYTVSYTLDQDDLDAGGVRNSVTATATRPNTNQVADVSDDGDDTDGNTTDDPTEALVTQAPALVVQKTFGTREILFPQIHQSSFTITVTNQGNITQTGMQIADDLASFVAPATLATIAPTVTVNDAGLGGANGAFDGAAVTDLLDGTGSLAPGASASVTLTVAYDISTGEPGNANTAEATSDQVTTPVTDGAGVPTGDTDGDLVPDTVELCRPQDDRDGDGICDQQDFDPTGYFYCEDTGTILSGGSISVEGPLGSQTGVGTSNNITILADGSSGFYQFVVSAPGTYRLIPTYPTTGVASTARAPQSTPLDATSLGGNPAVLGSSESGATGVLADFSEAANTSSYLTFVFDQGDPIILSNNLAMTSCATAPAVLATKNASLSSAIYGDTITYTMSFTNNRANTETNVSIVDEMPAGLLFTPGSATVDGVATAPTINGRTLTWDGLDIDPAQTITVVFSARVVSSSANAQLVNRTFMLDSGGVTLSNVATAATEVRPEPVFDCSDVIGRVFDDENRNGAVDEGETGLAGVRLATVNGVLITTDAHGRYHVPCAALPDQLGQNFALKLDTRTLPTGYRVTTENPRVIRLTKGKMARMNFGASISKVVEIDLTAAAFDPNGVALTLGLDRGLDQLVAQLASTPSVIRLSYMLNGEDHDTARARLDQLETRLREKWRQSGKTKLVIERTLKRIQ